MTTQFYDFRQNNSGGRFHIDEKLCKHVIIEAETEDDAIEKALDMGVYFNGCDEGKDCHCCGDRWHEPSVVEDIEFVKNIYVQYHRATDGPAYRIFYRDGRVEVAA